MFESVHENLSESAAANVIVWLEKPKYAEYRFELEQLILDEKWHELEDAFFKVIEFGTGGRRGTTGVGSNRINRVTIGESAQALCVYAKHHDESAPEKGIVIACDTRLSSDELSSYVAEVCAGNGFKTYLFDGFRSTPELSFAVRELGAAAGIVISASHNPPSDNGFKAYWSDGGQLVAPHDKGVLEIAEAIDEVLTVETQEAIGAGLLVYIGKEIDDAYVAAVCGESMGKDRDLKIVYSPLHGAGSRNTLPVLQAAGFKNIRCVDEQMIPDGNFPTVENGKPNPEEKAANDRAVALLLAEHADFAITNEPDADRVGVTGRQHDQAVYLNGNQSATLASEFVLRKLHESNQLTPKHYIAKTIVTTDMMTAVANAYGAMTYTNMLVGFKFIGELIKNKEDSNEIFVIGGEESYGLLKGTYARDKDGAVGALPLAEYAAELKLEGRTLWDRMIELYDKYGLFIERLDTLQCPGADGFKQMQTIMDSLRQDPPKKVDEHTVTAVYDYRTLERREIGSSNTTPIDCKSGDVLVYEFGDYSRRITIRPSGTEPKMKFYVQWKFETNDAASEYESRMQELENISRQLEGIALERS